MEEYLPIWDNKGKYTGHSARKEDVHKAGWCHPTIHIWLFDSSNNVLLQQRSLTKDNYPGLWDVSVAGHVQDKETLVGAAIRECKEEVGLLLAQNKLIEAGIYFSKVRHNDKYLDKEFNHVFLYILSDHEKTNIQINREELMDAKWLSWEKFRGLRKLNDNPLQLVPRSKKYWNILEVAHKKFPVE